MLRRDFFALVLFMHNLDQGMDDFDAACHAEVGTAILEDVLDHPEQCRAMVKRVEQDSKEDAE